MAPAERRIGSRRRSHAVVAALLVMTLAVSSCVVDSPSIEATTGGSSPSASAVSTPQGESPTADVHVEQTVTHATATPEPQTPAPPPTATAVPEPTATPIPAGPTPLPTSAAEGELLPSTVAPGLVAVPVRGAEFMLDLSRPVLQLGGHTLIYVDDELNAEVDIFIPAADRDGVPFAGYAAVVSFIQTDPVFANVIELTAVSIAGLPTRVFEGTAEALERAFITEIGATEEVFGWFPPVRMRLWLIDHPDGPVVVSAESLENPGRYSEAVRLATEVLSTIDFG